MSSYKVDSRATSSDPCLVSCNVVERQHVNGAQLVTYASGLKWGKQTQCPVSQARLLHNSKESGGKGMSGCELNPHPQWGSACQCAAKEV